MRILHWRHHWEKRFTKRHNEYYECADCGKRKVKTHIHNGTIAPVDQHWLRGDEPVKKTNKQKRDGI